MSEETIPIETFDVNYLYFPLSTKRLPYKEKNVFETAVAFFLSLLLYVAWMKEIPDIEWHTIRCIYFISFEDCALNLIRTLSGMLPCAIIVGLPRNITIYIYYI